MKQLFIAMLEENMKALEEIINFYSDELELVTEEYERLIERPEPPENLEEEFEKTVLEILLDTQMKAAEEDRDCDTCRYDATTSIFQSPCRECLKSESGEPICWEPIRKDYSGIKGHGRCSDCKHQLAQMFDEPCNECGHLFGGYNDNWEPKDIESRRSASLRMRKVNLRRAE